MFAACVALYFGWHPLPETAIGCSLHEKYHRGGWRAEPEKIIATADCIRVTIPGPHGVSPGRSYVIQGADQIEALRSWLSARHNLWAGAPILYPHARPRLRFIRPCRTQQPGYDQFIAANEDWLVDGKGKGLLRPICRGEWRELSALVRSSEP